MGFFGLVWGYLGWASMAGRGVATQPGTRQGPRAAAAGQVAGTVIGSRGLTHCRVAASTAVQAGRHTPVSPSSHALLRTSLDEHCVWYGSCPGLQGMCSQYRSHAHVLSGVCVCVSLTCGWHPNRLPPPSRPGVLPGLYSYAWLTLIVSL
jgi:hypothetical protein